mgnify:CR=1 FL=1
MYDIIIIGAGVTGCAVARYLSRYEGRMLVLEKAEDVCCGTSKANSAIIHAGFDAAPGSLKAKLNVRGNEMMDALSKDLDIPFKRNGSLVVCTKDQDRSGLDALLEKGEKNGVPGLRILEREELLQMEPNLSDDVTCGLYAPTGGIVCPFNLTIALAENACDNGVEFVFNTKAEKVEKTTEGYRVITNNGVFETKYVVNAAGVYSDEIHNMVSKKKLHIVPRRGEYCLLDKEAGNHVSATVFQLPGKYGKGILVSPTIHGNLLVGPTAVDQEDKDGTYTTAEGLAEACEKATKSVNNIPFRQVITSFSGLRAHEDGDDFIIGHHCSFFMLCVAKATFQVTSGETDENSRSPGIISLPLQTVKDFINLSHRSLICFVRYGLFFLIFRMVFYIIRGIVFYSVLLVNDNIAFRLLHLYFIALRNLFAHPAGNILCGGIEREYFIQVLVVEFFHDHFFNTGEIYHHTVCIESCRTAVDSDNPVVTM